jgi:WD40 repeat protein
MGHTGSVLSVSFSPNGGTHVVSGSEDKTIRVWDARTGDAIAGPFIGHTSCISSVAFSPDGTRIASGSYDKTVRVWNTFTGDSIVGPFTGHTNWIASVAFSPDGTHFVSGSWDKTIRVWDARTGNVIGGPFKGHTQRITSVAFSPNGTRIISGSEDGAIRVWDANNTVPEDFVVESNGWVTYNNDPLFWISLDFHNHLPHPHNTLLIGPGGSVFIDYCRLNVGKLWSDCYQDVTH